MAAEVLKDLYKTEPVAGAVYILTAERVHPLDVPFAQAIKAISRWESGSKDLVAAMQSGESA